MNEVSETIKENIYRQVRRDLEPSLGLIHTKVGLAVAVGGGLSLFFCGQMGLGLSPLAESVHRILMDKGGVLGCTVLCGLIFALVPVLLLRASSSAIQFVVILRRKRPIIVGWVLAFGAYLVLRSERADAMLLWCLWGVSAVLSFFVFARLIRTLTYPLVAKAH